MSKRGGKRPNYFKGEGWDPDTLRNFDASPLTFPPELLPEGLRAGISTGATSQGDVEAYAKELAAGGNGQSN